MGDEEKVGVVVPAPELRCQATLLAVAAKCAQIAARCDAELGRLDLSAAKANQLRGRQELAELLGYSCADTARQLIGAPPPCVAELPQTLVTRLLASGDPPKC